MSWKARMRFSSLHVFVSYVTSLGIWVPRIDKFTFEPSYPVVLCVSGRLILVSSIFLSFLSLAIVQRHKRLFHLVTVSRLCWWLKSPASYVFRLFEKSIQNKLNQCNRLLNESFDLRPSLFKIRFETIENHASWRTIGTNNRSPRFFCNWNFFNAAKRISTLKPSLISWPAQTCQCS